MGWNLEQVRLQALSGCNQGAAVEVDTIGEQQPKRMQSGSCSRSGHKRGAAAEAHAIRELLKSGKSSRSGRKLAASSS